MKIHPFLLSSLLWSSLLSAIVQAQGLDCSFQNDITLRDNLILRQVMNPNDETVTMQLVYTGGRAWLSLGFSVDGDMLGSNAVIGKPDLDNSQTNPGKYSLGGYDPVSGMVLLADESQTLTNHSIWQNDTHSILTFTQPLVEEGELPLSADEENVIIYAVGSSNVFGLHDKEGSRLVTFTPCREVGDNSTIPAPAPEPAPSPTAAPTVQAQELDCTFQNDITLRDDLILRQVMNPNNDTVTMQLVYTGGRAWLGLGFSIDGDMLGSNAVIGKPELANSQTNPGKYSLGGYDPVNGIVLLESQTLTNHSIWQNNTHSILTFTKPLVEEGELPLSADEENVVIYAVGSSNVFGLHDKEGSRLVTFTPCREVGDNSTMPAPEPAPSPTATPTAATLATSREGGFDDEGNFFGSFQLEPGLVDVVLQTNAADETFSVKMIYAGEGYVSLGVAAKPAGRMIGSTAVIGIPDQPVSSTNPGIYFLGGKTVSAIELLSAEEQKILTDTMIEQNETHTVMRFTKPLVASENDAMPVVTEGVNAFLCAVGRQNGLGNHRIGKSFALDMAKFTGGALLGNSSGSSTEKLWKAHGWLMAISWGILVPAAIGFSMLRNILPLFSKGGLWFRFHQALNGTAVCCVIAGFAIAVRAINKETAPGENANHFSQIPHRIVGLVVFLVAVLQAASGLFRPHAPKKQTDSHEEEEGEQEKDIEETGSSDSQAKEQAADNTKSTIRCLWEYQHRFTGLAALGLAWYNVQSGINLFGGRYGESFNMTAVFWGVAGGIAGIILILYAIQKLRQAKKG